MIREDKKISYLISFSICAVLLFSVFIPTTEISDELLYTAFLLPCLALVLAFIKRRKILSYNKGQVLMLMCACALTCAMLYYLTGLLFGYGSISSRQSINYVLLVVIPACAIIIITEIIRAILLMQNSKVVSICAYVIGVISEFVIFSNVPQNLTFYSFMDIVGLTLFPAFMHNYLFNYVSSNYGAKPNIAFRLIITVATIALWRLPLFPDALYSFAKIVIPLLIYAFIKTLYENKNRFAINKKSSKFSSVAFVATIAVMISVVMLISGQFRFGSIVIGSGSMANEINRGDVIVYDSNYEQEIKAGDVIVFYKYDTLTVHRVVDVKNINGTIRYYTKGDANENVDDGYITAGAIVGVVQYKVPYVGHATLALRELFDR